MSDISLAKLFESFFISTDFDCTIIIGKETTPTFVFPKACDRFVEPNTFYYLYPGRSKLGAEVTMYIEKPTIWWGIFTEIIVTISAAFLLILGLFAIRYLARRA